MRRRDVRHRHRSRDGRRRHRGGSGRHRGRDWPCGASSRGSDGACREHPDARGHPDEEHRSDPGAGHPCGRPDERPELRPRAGDDARPCPGSKRTGCYRDAGCRRDAGRYRRPEGRRCHQDGASDAGRRRGAACCWTHPARAGTAAGQRWAEAAGSRRAAGLHPIESARLGRPIATEPPVEPPVRTGRLPGRPEPTAAPSRPAVPVRSPGAARREPSGHPGLRPVRTEPRSGRAPELRTWTLPVPTDVPPPGCSRQPEPTTGSAVGRVRRDGPTDHEGPAVRERRPTSRTSGARSDAGRPAVQWWKKRTGRTRPCRSASSVNLCFRVRALSRAHKRGPWPLLSFRPALVRRPVSCCCSLRGTHRVVMSVSPLSGCCSAGIGEGAPTSVSPSSANHPTEAVVSPTVSASRTAAPFRVRRSPRGIARAFKARSTHAGCR